MERILRVIGLSAVAITKVPYENPDSIVQPFSRPRGDWGRTDWLKASNGGTSAVSVFG